MDPNYICSAHHVGAHSLPKGLFVDSVTCVTPSGDHARYCTETLKAFPLRNDLQSTGRRARAQTRKKVQGAPKGSLYCGVRRMVVD
jgi:hypothetical protein